MFNNKEERAFITVQSLKKLKQFQQDWALDHTGWRILDGGDTPYDIGRIDEEAFYDAVY